MLDLGTSLLDRQVSFPGTNEKLTVDRATAALEMRDPRGCRERSHPPQVEFLQSRKVRDGLRQACQRVAAEVDLPQFPQYPDRFLQE